MAVFYSDFEGALPGTDDSSEDDSAKVHRGELEHALVGVARLRIDLEERRKRVPLLFKDVKVDVAENFVELIGREHFEGPCIEVYILMQTSDHKDTLCFHSVHLILFSSYMYI